MVVTVVKKGQFEVVISVVKKEAAFGFYYCG